jgi:protein-disulfide isomerase
MDLDNPSTQQTNIFDNMPAKQAFWIGFVTAILSIGTLGFVVLGSCMLNGGCSIQNVEDQDDDVLADELVKDEAQVAPTILAGVPTVTESDHMLGDKNAPITIITYTDFQCPYCGRFNPTMEQVLEEYNGQVRWVQRDFPLSFHANAKSAANAAECAGEQGKYWEYGDKLFENQSSFSEDYYIELAKGLGLNEKSFTECVQSDKYASAIEAETQAGAAAGVSGTPGSFIIDQQGNATPIKGALPFETIAGALDGMLGK